MNNMNNNGIFYIENTVDEYRTAISGYFTSLDDAKDALKDCADWWRPNGTGRIYFREFGLNKNRVLVYESR